MFGGMKMNLKNKFKDKNLSIKLISLGMAVFLWAFVMGIVNPEIPMTYRGIEVQIEGQEYLQREGLTIISPKNPKINVEVMGTKADLNNISSNNIIAYMDLGGLKAGENNVDIKTAIQGQVGRAKIISEDPPSLIVNLDSVISENLKVEVEVLGELPESYTLGNVRALNNYVRVTAPSLLIDQISKVVSYVDISGKNESFIANTQPVYLDKNGLEIQDIQGSLSVVEVDVPILKLKSLPVEVQTIGTTRENDQVEDIRVVPESVIVKGLETQLEKIKSIKTNPVNLMELTETGSHKVTLNLPEGIIRQDEESLKIEYKYIKNVEKTLSVPSSNIEILNKKDNLSYSIPEGMENIEVVIFGESTLVNSIEGQDIQININGEGLSVENPLGHLYIKEIDGISVRSINPVDLSLIISQNGKEKPIEDQELD